jgi:hypothetical protein
MAKLLRNGIYGIAALALFFAFLHNSFWRLLLGRSTDDLIPQQPEDLDRSEAW